ncbi:esterase [Mycobacterium sp. GA-1199]|uniref:alpha/beta fold hydrolase n=1 Tax=Mycobacterium sp. GA-1199 TaxID=1772287 RepID=UPI0007478650|nr:alpha/beta hydrolase [Mycobacterium sp. GA-1199]KUI40847.1 esterase [Mycobacterium sp. GA-1199]
MALPALVLVHGGGLAADSWDLTIDEIHRREPELTVVAVDLPGRRGKQGDLHTLTIADFVDSVVRDIEDAGCSEVVIAGHSMAGLTVPGVVTKLGSSRVREMIFVAAFVPPEGKALADTITGLFARIARRRAKRSIIAVTPAWMVRIGFLNGTAAAQRRFMADRLYPESPHILAEKVSRQGMTDDIPRTWIMTRRDRALSCEFQRKAIEAIGGVQTIVEMETCHMAMVSEPARLAEILVERCRQYQ